MKARIAGRICATSVPLLLLLKPIPNIKLYRSGGRENVQHLAFRNRQLEGLLAGLQRKLAHVIGHIFGEDVLVLVGHGSSFGGKRYVTLFGTRILVCLLSRAEQFVQSVPLGPRGAWPRPLQSSETKVCAIREAKEFICIHPCGFKGRQCIAIVGQGVKKGMYDADCHCVITVDILDEVGYAKLHTSPMTLYQFEPRDWCLGFRA